MFVSGDLKNKASVMSLFRSITKICFNVLTLLYTDNCNSAFILNIFTIPSALESLEYNLFSKSNTLISAPKNTFFLSLIEKKSLLMGNLVVVGLIVLQPLFGAYEQFISSLWNVFFQALMIVNLYGTAPW